jgi:hypothetical protein
LSRSWKPPIHSLKAHTNTPLHGVVVPTVLLRTTQAPVRSIATRPTLISIIPVPTESLRMATCTLSHSHSIPLSPLLSSD